MAASTTTSQRKVRVRAQAGRKALTARYQNIHSSIGVDAKGLDISDSLSMLSDMNATTSIQSIQERIQQIKAELAALGEMRPGSLSKQYNVCGKPNCRCKDLQNPQRHGPYYQLSWVHRGKSTTQFIRRPFVRQVRAQIATYNRFRKLTDEWVNLALRLAQANLLAARRSLSK
jgi:hypothetical protein